MQLVQAFAVVQLTQGDLHAVHIPLSSKKVTLHLQAGVVRGPAMQIVQAVALEQFTQGGIHDVHIPLSLK